MLWQGLSSEDLGLGEGTFESRASYLTWLVEREAQRAQAWQEVLRMRRDGVPLRDPELAGMAEKLSRRSFGHLDERESPRLVRAMRTVQLDEVRPAVILLRAFEFRVVRSGPPRPRG